MYMDNIADTGKILVLPVLCTSIVVPVSRPAASYYPMYMSLFPIAVMLYLNKLGFSSCESGYIYIVSQR
jgi:hypothetical protein